VRTFAYPWGGHDAEVRAAVEAAGLTPAFAVEAGGGRAAIRRTPVRPTDTPRSFAAKLLPGYSVLRQALEPLPHLRRAGSRLLRSHIPSPETPLSQ
jgi:hypothetical protein